MIRGEVWMPSVTETCWICHKFQRERSTKFTLIFVHIASNRLKANCSSLRHWLSVNTCREISPQISCQSNLRLVFQRLVDFSTAGSALSQRGVYPRPDCQGGWVWFIIPDFGCQQCRCCSKFNAFHIEGILSILHTAVNQRNNGCSITILTSTYLTKCKVSWHLFS